MTSHFCANKSKTILSTSRLNTSRSKTIIIGRRIHSSRQTTRHSSTLQSQLSAAPSSASVQALAPPLSVLPTKTLLRSLLISAVSSKRYLLIPCLSILSFLSKPGRSYLLNVDRNPLLHSLLKKTFYNQFCAGESTGETRSTVQDLKDLGLRGVILTYAKETVFDHKTKTQFEQGFVTDSGCVTNGAAFCPTIESWRAGTIETIEALQEGDYLAVKMSGAGQQVTDDFAEAKLPSKQMLAALDEICTRCRDKKVRILVDGESQHFQWGILRTTLDLMRKYNRDGYALIYNTYQAYLKSTPSTLAKHLAAAKEEGFTLGLKLVRGAYINSDDRSLIHDTKEDTDNAYNTIAQGALKHQIGEFGAPGGPAFPHVNLFLASHNKGSVTAAHKMHQERLQSQVPTVPLNFGQLHGMSDAVSFGLLQMKEGNGAKPEVYKCSTWGSMGECLAYLLRRAVENRDAVSRTGDEYSALKTELRRRIKSTFSPSA